MSEGQFLSILFKLVKQFITKHCLRISFRKQQTYKGNFEPRMQKIVVEKPKLTIEIKVPEFTTMRITPPPKSEPLKMSPIDFNYQDSQYEPFSQEILQKIGVKFDQNISELSCLNCSSCKALSKDTLMEIDPKNFTKIQPLQSPQQQTPSQAQPEDELKRQKYLKLWNDYKKKQIRTTKVKFETAYDQYHNLTQSEWEEHIKTYYQ